MDKHGFPTPDSGSATSSAEAPTDPQAGSPEFRRLLEELLVERFGGDGSQRGSDHGNGALRH